MFKSLFEQQRQYLSYFFDAIDVTAMEKIFEILLRCKGSLILSGVGKSGHIAQKISATLVSTGTRASFLSPSQALHGDMGWLTPDDVFLAFSKSGETEELLALLPHIERRGLFRIAIVSRAASRLAKRCDTAIYLPVQRELCPYDLAPTTSTAVQLLFGDCLAMALMQAKRFSPADFAANHPAGALGRKVSLKVSDLMLTGDAVPRSASQEKLFQTLHELSVKRCGCLLIVDEANRLEGIFTDGDLRRAIQTRGSDALQETMGSLMNPSPRSISPQALAFQALRRMEEDPARLITVLPVLEEERLVGLLRMHDILQAGL